MDIVPFEFVCSVCRAPLDIFANATCFICGEVFCEAHLIERDGLAACAGCADERGRREAEYAVWSEEATAVTELLIQDMRTTIGPRLADDVRRRAVELRLLANGFDDYRQRLVDDIQQRIHDEFIDTSWPACPGAHNHPLWFVDGEWRCRAHRVAIPLGALSQREE